MTTRPNILLIVADDLGFSDVGCFGSEIETPNIDRLAKEGVRFSDFHTASSCSPTRSMIMSGTDNHIAGLGVMYEHRLADPERWNKPGHEGYLNYDVAALPELLDDAGYWNVISGKWHLGFREQHLPSSRGFHKEMAFLPGCGNSFGWEPVAGAQEWSELPKGAGQLPLLYVRDGKKWMPEPNRTNSESGFYQSDWFADNLIDSLKDRPNKPFFAYLPFCAPHWPIQCREEDRAKYRGRYDDGPDKLRLERLEKLVQLGLIKSDVIPHEVFATTKEWEDMTAEERKMSARAMETYGGMVHAMDRAIGRVLDYLDENELTNNTMIIFMSDNGAEGAALEAYPIFGANLLATIDKYYDNSLDNLGNHNSFCWIGPRWAQASTAPNRLMKTFITEGGIRVPFVMRYPPIKSYQPGEISHSFGTCMDLLPTFLEMAGGHHPNPTPNQPTEKKPYRGRDVYGIRGKSWISHLMGSEEEIHSVDSAPVGWEAHNRAGLRHGKWKLIYIPLGHPTGTGKWQLYDLERDQGETNDLADKEPKVLADMLTMWDAYVVETGTVFGPPIKPFGTSTSLLPDQVGGDPIDDQRIWMQLGTGKRFVESADGARKTAL